MPRATDSAIVGKGVFIPDGHPGVRFLLRNLEKASVAARDNGIQLDPRLTELLQDLVTFSVGPPQVPATVPGLGQSGSAAPGLALLKSVESGGTSEGMGMSTSDVAARVGITERAVRKAALAGRLAGRHTDLGWQFSEAAVNAWRNKRSARIETGEVK